MHETAAAFAALRMLATRYGTAVCAYGTAAAAILIAAHTHYRQTRLEETVVREYAAATVRRIHPRRSA